MFRDPNFWQAYVDRWTDVRRGKISNDGMDAILDKLATEVAESRSRDLARWGQAPRSTGPFESGALNGTWEGEVEHLRRWLHARAEFIDSNFVAPPSVFVGEDSLPVDIKGRRVDSGTQISITGPVGNLFDDTHLVSSDSDTTVNYFVPIDNTLGETWAQIDFDDSAWQSGPTGLGAGDDFAEFFRTQVEPKAVQEGATTILARYEFELSDLQAVRNNLLQLRVKYDDGFVAYMNGTEVDRVNLRDDELSWNSRAKAFPKADAVRFHDFDISEFRDLFVAGKNVLGIRVINSSATSGDILLLPELITRAVRVGPNPNGQVYYTTDGTDPRGPDGMPTESATLSSPDETFTVTDNVRITARYFDDVTDRGFSSNIVGTDWSGLTFYDFVVEDSPLVISEINYHPLPPTEVELQVIPDLTDDDFEFLEVYNPGSTPISLIGTELAEGVEFDFINSPVPVLEAGERILVVSNQSAFDLRYGNHHRIAGEFTGNLSNRGEQVDLIDGTGAILVSANYDDDDPWPLRADGEGSSLELFNPENTPSERAGKHYSWRASREVGGSPGTAGQDPVGVVINEVLAHTEGEVNLTDLIELYNATSESITIGGWFLSDSTDDFFKFQVPDGTVLDAGQYLVFDESDFNPTPDDPAPKHFALSGDQGDSVWLVIPGGDQIGAFVDDVHFRETSNGVSMGRLPNGSGRLTPLSNTTFGTDNGSPSVPSVAITELNYYPGKPSDTALSIAPLLNGEDLEFIELHNSSDTTADLTNWRLRGGVDFNINDSTTIDAGKSLLIVKFDPENPDNINRLNGFRAHYNIDESVRVVGGYAGQLNNADDKVLLLRPDVAPMNRPDFIPHVQEDEVLYDDLAPWPASADGTGNSLQRLATNAFGSDASSWFAAVPTPGSFSSTLPGDFDGSGIVDTADIDLLFGQLRTHEPDLIFDLTGDSLVDSADRDRLVQDILKTNYGDSNLDGTFGSRDLVQVFQVGEYEDNIELNSTWEDGDWDGNGDFDTRDLVLAFQAGAFVAEGKSANKLNSYAAALTIKELTRMDDQVNADRLPIDAIARWRRFPLKLEQASVSCFQNEGPKEIGNDDGPATGASSDNQCEIESKAGTEN